MSFPQTVDAIVTDILQHLSEEDKVFFRRIRSDGKDIVYHMAMINFTMWIRNKYGLWHDHPLTERWRKEETNDLRNGTDHSIDHPDNISEIIKDRVLEELRILV